MESCSVVHPTPPARSVTCASPARGPGVTEKLEPWKDGLAVEEWLSLRNATSRLRVHGVRLPLLLPIRTELAPLPRAMSLTPQEKVMPWPGRSSGEWESD